jgi:hypothetical protein
MWRQHFLQGVKNAGAKYAKIYFFNLKILSSFIKIQAGNLTFID